MSQRLQVLVILLAVCAGHQVSCDTFHILTNLSSSSCPGEFVGEPCLTLSQYVANPSQGRNNTTLQFEPGTHYLPDVLSINDGHSFTIAANNVTVICTTSLAKITLSSVESVHISGMTFQWCNATVITLSQVAQATLARNTYVENYNTFGALRVTSSSLVISDSNFNRTGSSFHGFSSGAISTSHSNITIVRTVFTALSGGIIGGGESNVTISECTCSNSWTRFDHAIVYVNVGSSNNNVLRINRSTFRNNTALRVIIAPNVIIDRSEFTYNTASPQRGGNGGGVMETYTAPTIRNSIFNSNSGHNTHGGAIIVLLPSYGGESVVLENCTFSSNKATGESYRNLGGVIYLRGGTGTRPTILRLSTCTFINNGAVSGGNGGVIYTIGNNIQIDATDCHFENNFATDNGGGIYSEGTNNSIKITGSTFINNTVEMQSGGVIYTDGLYTNIEITQSTFNYSSAPRCSVMDINNYNHSVSVVDSVFASNGATASGEITGGGVACMRNATININGSLFENNFANSNGGVFYIDESTVSVDGSRFINNSALVHGGVFFTYVHTSNYDITRSLFSHCSAGNDGGVLYLGRKLGQIFIDETTFAFNSATDRGGVISIVNCSLEISQASVFNNTANYGAVISACNSNVTLASNDFLRRSDPEYPFCVLYEGDDYNFNIQTPSSPTLATPPRIQTTDTTIPPVTTETETLLSTLPSTSTTTNKGDGYNYNISTPGPPTSATPPDIQTTDTTIPPATTKKETTQPTLPSTSTTTNGATTTINYQSSPPITVDNEEDDSQSTGIGFVVIVLIALVAVITVTAVLAILTLTVLFSYKMKRARKERLRTVSFTQGNPSYNPVIINHGANNNTESNSSVTRDIEADADTTNSYVDVNADAESYVDMNAGVGSTDSYVDMNAGVGSTDSYVDMNAGVGFTDSYVHMNAGVGFIDPYIGSTDPYVDVNAGVGSTDSYVDVNGGDDSIPVTDTNSIHTYMEIIDAVI